MVVPVGATVVVVVVPAILGLTTSFIKIVHVLLKEESSIVTINGINNDGLYI